MKVKALVTHIEFHSHTPLPPELIVSLKCSDFKGYLVVKVGSNQKDLTGGFTIRGRLCDIAGNNDIFIGGVYGQVIEVDGVRTMEVKQIKEMLAGQGLSKQEVEIVLAAIKGVKVAPLAYAELNAMTEEVVELKEFRDRTQQAFGSLGLGSTEPKKQRAPRSDKGSTKATIEAPAKMEVSKEPVKDEPKKSDEPVKTDKPAGGKDKKKPTPRNIKAEDADKPKPEKKESANEIKDNIANLGDGPTEDEDDIPL